MKRDRQRKREREAKFCEERVVGVEPIRNNGPTIGLSGAYTRFARTCNSKWKGGRISGAGVRWLDSPQRGGYSLGRSLISSSILSRKSVQRPGKVLSFSPNSLCLSAASTPVNLSLSLSLLSNLIYPEPLLILIVTWIRVG